MDYWFPTRGHHHDHAMKKKCFKILKKKKRQNKTFNSKHRDLVSWRIFCDRSHNLGVPARIVHTKREHSYVT